MRGKEGGEKDSGFRITVHHRRTTGQGQKREGPEAGANATGHGGVLLTSLLLWLIQSVFFFFFSCIAPRTTRPGITQPPMGWALPHQSLNKEIPYRLASSPILWVHLHSSLYQVDTKQHNVSILVLRHRNLTHPCMYK